MAEIHFTPLELNYRCKDIAGQRFARLTVIAPIGRGSDGRIRWLCDCDCGNWKAVLAKHLISGHTKSCGCYRIDVITTHGRGRTEDMDPTFRSWLSMRSRCTQPSEHAFQHYGGRGIVVCDRWLNSFESFLADMGERPSRKYSIDRIDVDGNYEPGNCRWATRAEQNRNKRTNVNVTIDDETKCIKDWFNVYNISPDVYYNRLKRGWSKVEAITGNHNADT